MLQLMHPAWLAVTGNPPRTWGSPPSPCCSLQSYLGPAAPLQGLHPLPQARSPQPSAVLPPPGLAPPPPPPPRLCTPCPGVCTTTPPPPRGPVPPAPSQQGRDPMGRARGRLYPQHGRTTPGTGGN